MRDNSERENDCRVLGHTCSQSRAEAVRGRKARIVASGPGSSVAASSNQSPPRWGADEARSCGDANLLSNLSCGGGVLGDLGQGGSRGGRGET